MKQVAAIVPLLAALACSAPSEPAKADPPVNQQQIIDRLTKNIWPAVEQASGPQWQLKPGKKALAAVTDPSYFSEGYGGDGWTSMLDIVETMGRQGEYDAKDQTTHSSDNWRVATANVTSISDTKATAIVCYTYKHHWYVNIKDTHDEPGASEATVQLANVNNVWYLHSITNDHVVPDCQSSKA